MAKFMVSLSGGLLLDEVQLEKLAALIENTERINKKWVGTSVNAPEGYLEELVPTKLNDILTTQLLPESRYYALRFMAANKSE